MAVRFGLLGAVEASVDGVPIALGHAQLRCMLAALLVDADHPVTVDQLIDRVWAEGRLPRQPRRAVQHNIPLLRRALAAAPDVALTRSGSGYRLSVDRDAVDLHRFHALLAEGRAAADSGDDARAAALLEEALALWRAEPFADLDIDTRWLHDQRVALAAHQHAARLDLTDIQLRRGRHGVLLAELADQSARQPLDERLAGQYLLALYRTGCSAQALEHYHQFQRRLSQELGVDPGPLLQQLHQRILAADPALDLPAHTLESAAATPSPAGPAPVPPPPVPRQLLAPPRLFTGRAAELGLLDQALAEQTGPGALTTLAISAIGGAGGIGKTALAMHWAHRHLDRFPDGQLYVDLHGFGPSGRLTPVGEAVRAFLDALGADASALPVELDAQAALYRSLVADKRMLIVLDNAHDADQVVPLLPGSPTCTVLVTSRRRLSALAALHGALPLDLDVLPEADARDLLARHLGPRRLTDEPAAAADLLAVCGGLPLALRLVAAHAAQHADFPLAALADELRDISARLDALTAGDLRANLRAALSWSVSALSPDAAVLFGLLGVAPGPDFSLPAVGSLFGRPLPDTRAAIRELEDAYLVHQHAPGRYRMHDLVRLYAAEQASTDQPAESRRAALRRAADFYLHTAFAADRLLDPHRAPIELDEPVTGCVPDRPGDAAQATEWLGAEHACVLAAQEAAVAAGWHARVWQLAWALSTFHFRRGDADNQLTAWRRGLEAATRLDQPAVQALAHTWLGQASAQADGYAAALDHLNQALALAERAGDALGLAHVHRILCGAMSMQDDHRRSLTYGLKALQLFREAGDPVWEGQALNGIGWAHAHLGDLDQARAACEAALALNRGHRDHHGEAGTLDTLGYIAARAGRPGLAITYYRAALDRMRDIGDSYRQVDSLEGLAEAHDARGQHEHARRAWQQALELCHAQHRPIRADRIERRLVALDGPLS